MHPRIFRPPLVLAAACQLLTAGLVSNSHAAAAETPRQRLSLDAGWKFHLDDAWPDAIRLDKAGASSGPVAVSFNDTYWRRPGAVGLGDRAALRSRG